MKLTEIKKSYDVIIPCGSACTPALNLRRLGLRRFSLPLDWVFTESFAEVARLYSNQFKEYMELKNLTLVDGSGTYFDDDIDINAVNTYFVRDNHYKVTSVHDFPILPDKEWFETYPDFKENLDKRIARFIETIKDSDSILFVRWSTKYKQATLFQQAMKDMLKEKEFTILILIPSDDATSISDLAWNIENVCVLEVPNQVWDEAIWDHVLSGIQLNSQDKSLSEQARCANDFNKLPSCSENKRS
ncbi:papain-like cysteine peptidase [[Brevibacterium] frigoritolerans]|nr:papain-like cysteine peptidase [Peribacillus frigoritolerans]